MNIISCAEARTHHREWKISYLEYTHTHTRTHYLFLLYFVYSVCRLMMPTHDDKIFSTHSVVVVVVCFVFMRFFKIHGLCDYKRVKEWKKEIEGKSQRFLKGLTPPIILGYDVNISHSPLVFEEFASIKFICIKASFNSSFHGLMKTFDILSVLKVHVFCFVLFFYLNFVCVYYGYTFYSPSVLCGYIFNDSLFFYSS